MSLIFTKINDYYTAVVIVTADYNLHIEKNDSGIVMVEQSTVADSGYENVYTTHATIIDKDFSNDVYPKYVRIRTTSETTKAVLTASIYNNNNNNSEDIKTIMLELSEIKEKQAMIETAIPTEDLDGNGIPDGIDKINALEEASKPMTDEEINEAWSSIFNNN